MRITVRQRVAEREPRHGVPAAAREHQSEPGTLHRPPEPVTERGNLPVTKIHTIGIRRQQIVRSLPCRLRPGAREFKRRGHETNHKAP